MSSLQLPASLPPEVALALRDFCTHSQQGFGDHLISLVLFGSAAEGRMRATSDVNLLVVLREFDATRVDAIRESVRTAWAAVQLRPMFVLESELPAAAGAFAVKFSDILGRRQVLFGSDPFATITIPRAMIIHRLRQVLLNTTLRMRTTYALVSLREEQLAAEIADASAPLRSSAQALLALEGHPAASPKEALAMLCASLPAPAGANWTELLNQISIARENAVLPPGIAPAAMLRLIDLARAISRRVDSLAA